MKDWLIGVVRGGKGEAGDESATSNEPVTCVLQAATRLRRHFVPPRITTTNTRPGKDPLAVGAPTAIDTMRLNSVTGKKIRCCFVAGSTALDPGAARVSASQDSWPQPIGRRKTNRTYRPAANPVPIASAR